VVLMLAGFVLSIYAGDSNRKLIFSAVMLALAAFTKQTGFIIAAGLALYLFLKIGQRAGVFLTTFSALTVIPMLVLNWRTDGWFFYHIFYIGSADPIEVSRLVNFLIKELFGIMAGLSWLAFLIVVLGIQRMRLKVFLERPWLIALSLAIVISGLGRMRVGGNINNRMPTYAILCIMPAIFMQMLAPQLSGPGQIDDRNHIGWQNWVVAILMLVQFALGRYSPQRSIPNALMKQGGDRLIQQITSMQDPVLVMMHPYYALMAGKEPSTQIATLWYVRHRGEKALPDDFVKRIQSHYYSAIISDESIFETQPDIHKLLTAYYLQTETINLNESPSTMTGVLVRPKIIYYPKQP
jgi:hypothetical protein